MIAAPAPALPIAEVDQPPHSTGTVSAAAIGINGCTPYQWAVHWLHWLPNVGCVVRITCIYRVHCFPARTRAPNATVTAPARSKCMAESVGIIICNRRTGDCPKQCSFAALRGNSQLNKHSPKSISDQAYTAGGAKLLTVQARRTDITYPLTAS